MALPGLSGGILAFTWDRGDFVENRAWNICYSLCVCACAYAIAHVWRLEDSLLELVLAFFHVSPGDRTQVIGLGSCHLHTC